MAVAAASIIYILIGVEDHTWAAEAAAAAENAGYFINLFAFVVILSAREYSRIVVNLIFSLLMLAFTLLGVMDAFPGTGDRYGNHWADATAWIGLFNYLVIGAALPKQGWIALAAFASAFPVVTIAAYLELTTPLAKEFAAIDHQTACMFRITKPAWNVINTSRIYAFSEVDLGYFIGEHSPRVAKVQGEGVYLWRYGAREFSKSYRDVGLFSDLVRRCAAERGNR
ncbi:hypothetical protein CH339_10375 [Rhodobium orientis]|uniref:Uncharacterized protein n=2 Tax=Rhodobium orientis TaxID=34017 RepID=A0A327JPH5_9HYPH|nr:hypothetical protein [Rhodobium orientis]RAI27486.1 hypothetical protein CH339_10375 [Rhodobium orientis]